MGCACRCGDTNQRRDIESLAVAQGEVVVLWVLEYGPGQNLLKGNKNGCGGQEWMTDISGLCHR